ncbi:MAG: MarR family transcriptional regulator [Cyclobacteriaceae bacterium]|jgi:DNA-binding MarR family transcriptional regulator|nr:MarR family transcriptional regulator [Cyclobacteriaceae bacterium]
MRREETVDYHIRSAWLAIARMYNQQAAKHDATMAEGFVLLNIDVEEGTPATKIAPLMGLEPRSLTRLLKSMEERGAIYRKVDENDKRSVRIFLTEEGLKGRDRSKETVLRLNEVIRSEIPEEKLKVFFEVIQHINRIIERNNIFETVDN